MLPEPAWQSIIILRALFTAHTRKQASERCGSRRARADQSELRNGATNSEAFARRSQMANVIDQDQQWLLNCLSATLDPNQEVRSFAEASLNQASLQPGSCFHYNSQLTVLLIDFLLLFSMLPSVFPNGIIFPC